MLKYMIGGLAALTILAGVGNAPNSNPFKILDSVSAQANELDTTAPIDVVYFKLGKLVQTNKSKGIWTEYDSRGAERYKFKTSDYSSDSLVLKGTKGNVRLIVDFTKNIISGEWPGHDMSLKRTRLSLRLHRVRRKTFLPLRNLWESLRKIRKRVRLAELFL